MRPAKESVGERFGRLTVLNVFRDSKYTWADVKCDCGVGKQVLLNTLRQGSTVSCGCFHLERIKEVNTTHGHAAGHLSREYRAYRDMHRRCYYPHHNRYHRYGGRGIGVCAEWRDPDGFKRFLADMGACPPELTLDRINNDADYSAENCRWASRGVQAANRAATRFVEFKNELKPLSEWAAETGIPHKQLYQRIFRLGWSVERALTQPLRGKNENVNNK